MSNMRVYHVGVGSLTAGPFPCNCVGPQPGERLCPCALRLRRQQEQAMLRDGVVIGGEHYTLVKTKATRDDR